MKILVVGGTGLTGAHASLYLRGQGHEVTIASRSAPGNPVLGDFDHLAGDYIAGDLPVSQLEGFDLRRGENGLENVLDSVRETFCHVRTLLF